MQSEMAGRYFPTLTTSRSNNRNITQVLLTESHCGERMKCQGWNANGWSFTLYKGEKMPSGLVDFARLVFVWFRHNHTTQCATLFRASPHSQVPLFEDDKCQEWSCLIWKYVLLCRALQSTVQCLCHTLQWQLVWSSVATNFSATLLSAAILTTTFVPHFHVVV